MCSRKKPVPTMPYVASSLGQRATVRMQSARITAVGIRATDGSGRISAVMIPITAMSARPTNGWRGALINFIHRLFAHRALGRQARNRELQSQERGKTSNAQRPTPNAQLSELEVGRWALESVTKIWDREPAARDDCYA